MACILIGALSGGAAPEGEDSGSVTNPASAPAARSKCDEPSTRQDDPLPPARWNPVNRLPDPASTLLLLGIAVLAIKSLRTVHRF